jgi:hypothetical protein
MSIVVSPPPASKWSDITAHLPAGSPMTFGRSDGVGALQFSAATYQAGGTPEATPEILLGMLNEFGALNGLGQARSVISEAGPPAVAAGTFHVDVLIPVWYVFDGANFALATYTCAHENASKEEMSECEAIVRSIRVV